MRYNSFKRMGGAHMGKKSVKEDKNIYQIAREEAGLTRAAASELMDFVPESRIEKIESERALPRPEDVLAMSKAYKKPGLCNYYCSKACPIGQEFVPAVELKGLTQIALEVLNSLNKLTKEKERLIEISVDGRISEDEIKDFARIRHELNSISATVDALQLWVSDTIAANGLDKAELDRLTGELME